MKDMLGRFYERMEGSKGISKQDIGWLMDLLKDICNERSFRLDILMIPLPAIKHEWTLCIRRLDPGGMGEVTYEESGEMLHHMLAECIAQATGDPRKEAA